MENEIRYGLENGRKVEAKHKGQSGGRSEARPRSVRSLPFIYTWKAQVQICFPLDKSKKETM